MYTPSVAPAPQIQAASPAGGKRSPGRPRSEHARQAILRCTLDLLRRTGFAELCIETVAHEAGVGKATVYRWWPSKAALVADAFLSSAEEELRFPDTGSVHHDMRLQIRQLIRILDTERGKVVAALIGGGQSDPELIQAFRERFMRPRRLEAYETLRRGIQRGELAADLDLDLVLDSLYGPVYLRYLIGHQPLTGSFVDRVCDLVLRGSAQGQIDESGHGSARRKRGAAR
jgi:AcrR family transcriptional regulator